MRYLKFSVLLSTLLLIYSGCDNSDDSDSLNEPYFSIEVGSYAHGYEEWIFITNTSGGLVGYERVPKEGASVKLVKKMAPLSGKINVYVMTVVEDAVKRSFSCQAFLGLETGQTYRNINLPPGKVEYSDIDVRVGSPPYPAVFQESWSSSRFSVSSDTTYIKDEKIISDKDFVAYFTSESMLYAEIENDPNPQKFGYPDDFKEFDHQIEIPTGIYPSSVVTVGTDPGTKYFMMLFSAGYFETLEFNKSIKLCYLNGFKSYYTSYGLGNRYFTMEGDIPTLEEATIPDHDVSVINNTLFNFSADVPAEISYRSSSYEYEVEIEGKRNVCSIYVRSANASPYQFDLSLPQEFRDAYPEILFSNFKYTGTSFVQTSIEGGYKKSMLNALDNTLSRLNGYSYSYSVK